MVRPTSGSTWYVQGRPSILTDGSWEVVANIGGDKLGIGEEFQIAAIAMQAEQCRVGSELVNLPVGGEVPSIVKVVRRD